MDVLFRHEGDKVEIHVIDAGVGIPVKVRKTMFHITAKDSEDSGNGSLPVAAEMIRDLGGDIEYVSVSENTHFKITLPLGEAKPNQLGEVG